MTDQPVAKWVKIKFGAYRDPDIDEYGIGAAGFGLFVMMCCLGQERQNPRIPMTAIRRLPGGHRGNLRRLTAAGWLIEIEQGRAFFIRNLEKYSDQQERPGRRRAQFPPAPEPDPAPPRVVSPRVSEVRREAGRKGGLAKAKRRRPEQLSDAEPGAPEPLAKPDDFASDVAKSVTNNGHFATKTNALSGKNGHETSPNSVPTHAGASDSVLRITEKKESNTVDVSEIENLYPPAARVDSGNSRETSTDEDFEQSSGLKQETPFDGASYWSPEQLTAIVAECPQVAYWSHQKRAAVSEIEHVTGDTHSRADWGLLFDAAFNGDRLDVLHAAITTVKGAKRRGSPPANMGAYANTTITNFLGRVQIFVPSAAERAELPPDIRSELRSQFSDDAISPPADARDGPGAR